jgi:nucleoside-diphosphate-sugar epimerase
MKVLVIGSEGFIGKHLVPRLSKECEVVTLDETGANGSFKADIRESLTVTGAALGSLPKDITHFVHLAAIASPRIADKDRELAWAVNVHGTHNVLDYARTLGARKVIFLSSAHVYGISPKYMPSDEHHPLALHDTYTTTKILGEQLCQLFHENYGLSYTTLRLFNGYGPGQSPDYFQGQKLKEAKTGHMTLRGAGVTKDWVYVDDVVDAIFRALLTEYVGPINVGTGVETSLLEIATYIAKSFSATIDLVEDGPNDPGPSRMRADINRARKVLGWIPRVGFEEGLARTIEASR